MSKLTWIIFSIVTVGFLAILVIFNKSTAIDISKTNVSVFQTANDQNGQIGDNANGLADSKVTLIEYGDFQCAPCGSIFPVVKSVTAEYSDRIHIIFRNFPIPNSHPNAKAAAAAAEAAGLQGKYWEMHDKIYESQSAWSDLTGTARDDYFISLAKNLGLNNSQFVTDMASDNVSAKINYDQALGRKAGVDATPTFLLNGKKLTGDQYGDAARFKATIDAALTAAGISS